MSWRRDGISQRRLLSIPLSLILFSPLIFDKTKEDSVMLPTIEALKMQTSRRAAGAIALQPYGW